MRKLFWIGNIFLLAACSSPKSEALRINIGSEPQSLHPQKARDLQSRVVTQMFFEGLTRINTQGNIELAAAKEFEVSEDGKTYTFHLREAKWSQGEAVLAADFVYAWKKALSPQTPADLAFHFFVIKGAREAKAGLLPLEEVGIKALDAKTLQIELEKPLPGFLQMLALNAFFPVHQRTDEQVAHWTESGASYVGNGPFLLKSWRHSDSIEVVKNPHYWDAPSVKLGKIELVMVGEDTELRMYEKKELDWAGSPLSTLPLNALHSLKKQKGFHTSPFLATYFFRLNTQKAPFNDGRVRKAFALAINRQEIVDHVLQGYQLPATALVPPSIGLQSKPYFQDGGTKEALALLEGLPKLEPVTLLYPASERNHLIAQVVQQEWLSSLGVTVHLEPVERRTFYDKVSRGDFQMTIGSWTADYSDPMNFLEVFKYKTSGSNNTGWENPHYTTLLEAASSSLNTEERKVKLREAESLLMEEMPIIPVFHYKMLYLARDRLQGVALSELGGIDFKWATVTKED